MLLILGLAMVCAALVADPTARRAEGEFEVKMSQLASAVPAIAHMSLEKTLHGGLEATSKAEMLSGGDVAKGSAGYVAMEVVSGKLDGRSGSFILQHTATMHAGSQQMSITVVPGSGTGELAGIAGSFTITITGGKHFYKFDYTLPAEK